MQPVRYFTLIGLFITLFCFQETEAQVDFIVTQATSDTEVKAWIDTIFLSEVSPTAKKNIVFRGDYRAVGHYTGGLLLGLTKNEGLIMTTGFADDANKANQCGSNANASNSNNGIDGDPDLILLNGSSSHDAAIIELDFKPSVDTVRFSYLFASEEYHDYVLHGANDVFGFFLSGPGIDGPFENAANNIALIPGTDIPVAIDNINFGPGGGAGFKVCMPHGPTCNNCQYLVDNSMEDTNIYSPFQQFVFDAYTTPLIAKSAVTPCEWYHIKLIVGDAHDQLYDTGVLLEKGSFDPGNLTQSNKDDISSLYESCNNNKAILYFKISNPIGIDYILPFSVEGSATRGNDYSLISTTGENLIRISAGELYDSLIIIPYSDNLTEGVEEVEIVFNPDLCDPVPDGNDTAVIFIKDNPPFHDLTKYYYTVCEDTLLLTLNNAGGIPPYRYDWYRNNSTDSVLQYVISGTDSVMIPCLLYDSCEFETYNEVYVLVKELNASAGPDKDMCNNTSVVLEGTADNPQFINWTASPDDPSLAGQEDTIQPEVSPAVTTTYVLKAWDNCTHEDHDTVMVAVDEAIANISGKNSICLGDTLILSCNPSSVYQWTASPDDPSLADNGQDTTQTVMLFPGQNTTYTVTVVNECGFSANNHINVKVNALPAADAGIDNEICKGESYSLDASGGTRYFWSSIPYDSSLFTIGQDTLPDPVVTPDQQTRYTYIVRVADGNGCMAEDSMYLLVKPVPAVAIISSGDTICFGEQITLETTGSNITSTWNSSPNDPSLTGQEHNTAINVSPVVTTLYTLTASSPEFECEAVLTKSVEVIEKPTVSFSTELDTICQNTPLKIIFTGNASGNAVYNWSYEDGQIINGPYQDSITIQWPSSGEKVISLIVEEPGCFSSNPEQKSVEVLPTPVIDFTATPTEGCYPLEVQFTSSVNHAEGTVSYFWVFDTLAHDTISNPVITYDNPEEYSAKLTINSAGKCKASLTKTNFIGVFDPPVAAFNVTPEKAELKDATFIFTNQSSVSDPLSYLWDFDDGNSSEKNPSHTYHTTGDFQVVLTVNTQHSCNDTSSFTITVEPDLTLYIPNAFSPNGDGLNDTFKIRGVGIKEYLLQIYSRWGNLIYESTNLEDEWDAANIPGGVYLYVIHARTLLDKPVDKKGTVTVVK